MTMTGLPRPGAGSEILTAEETVQMVGALQRLSKEAVELLESEAFGQGIATVLKEKRDELLATDAAGDDIPIFTHLQSNAGKLTIKKKLTAIRSILTAVDSLVGE
jgi:hypothetical protein